MLCDTLAEVVTAQEPGCITCDESGGRTALFPMQQPSAELCGGMLEVTDSAMM